MHEIELATPEDVRSLPGIELQASVLFRESPLTAHIPAEATPLDELEHAQRAGHLWVARDERGTPIAFAVVGRLGAGYHLEELDVLPEHGRRGIGSALVREVCAWARREGASLTLTTFREIRWNAPFYARLGFRPLSAAEISPELEDRMREEAAAGLAPEHRVAMRWSAK